MLESITTILIAFAQEAGYLGVYLYMLLVGTFIPVPSEIILIPSGYLASLEERSFILLLISGALGSLSGALINYFLARYLIHHLFKKKATFRKIILFFRQHGKISVFLAPLTPGLGQYISIPAGFSRMKLSSFIPLTFLANLIWVGFMLLIGYIFGEGEKAHQNVVWFSLILLGFVIVSISLYVWREIKKVQISNDQNKIKKLMELKK